jgi:hypothetical protein
MRRQEGGSTAPEGGGMTRVIGCRERQLTTVLNHYVRAGEDALRDSVAKLEHK